MVTRYKSGDCGIIVANTGIEAKWTSFGNKPNPKNSLDNGRGNTVVDVDEVQEPNRTSPSGSNNLNCFFERICIALIGEVHGRLQPQGF